MDPAKLLLYALAARAFGIPASTALPPASLFSRFSPLETGWLAQLLIPGMRRSFSKTGADPGDQLLGPRDQLLFLVRGPAPGIRAPPFPLGPPRLPTAPACCPAQGPASAGKPHVKSARRERGNLRRYATESTASPSRSGTIAVYTGSMTTTTALNKVSFCVSRAQSMWDNQDGREIRSSSFCTPQRHAQAAPAGLYDGKDSGH